MKHPSILKSFAVRSFFQTSIFSTLLFGVVALFCWQLEELVTPLSPLEYLYLFLFFFLFGILQWMFQKNTLGKLVTNRPDSTPKREAVAAVQPESESDRASREKKEQRLFVHLFAVLQRKGRLMDFLQEDLSLYQDDQIGAAVRNIHENCRKTVAHYLAPEPVMPQAEGEQVQIEAGFDQHAVKLVGNVAGQPPFSGILRHRGWQLQTIQMPELSETENPRIIAPAEVEIQ